jgi:putative nucleotidyltransferase with HDIG domain
MIEAHKIVEGIDALPTMPIAVSRMAQALADPDAGIKDVVDIVKYEPGLTGNILKMANSAYFGSTGPIDSIHQAVTRLGMQQVFRLVVISSAHTTMAPSVSGYDMPSGALWRHSVACALATQCLAEQIGVGRAETAFTSALLHDVGKLVIGNCLGIDFAAIEKYAGDNGVPFEQAERQIIGADHAQIGAAILEKWHLPQEVVAGVRWHHEPDALEGKSPMVDLVHVADAICVSMGLGTGRDGLYHRPSSSARTRCGISKLTMEQVISRTLGAMNELADLFSLPKEEAYHAL